MIEFLILAQFHSLTPTSNEPIMPPTYSWQDQGQTSGTNSGFSARTPAISNYGSGGGTGGLASPPPVVNDFGNMR